MSPLAFRNITTSPSAPVATWPLEGIQAALERGTLRDWRRLAREIEAEPWGPAARAIEEVLTYARPYGVAEALERVIASARGSTEEVERRAVAAEIAGLIHASGLPRVEFASRIGTSASRLSTYTTARVTPSAALMVRMRRLVRSLHPVAP